MGSSLHLLPLWGVRFKKMKWLIFFYFRKGVWLMEWSIFLLYKVASKNTFVSTQLARSTNLTRGAQSKKFDCRINQTPFNRMPIEYRKHVKIRLRTITFDYVRLYSILANFQIVTNF